MNGNRYLPASNILEKYKIGKVIGDGNFAVVKECVERYIKHRLEMFNAHSVAVCSKSTAVCLVARLNETGITCSNCSIRVFKSW